MQGFEDVKISWKGAEYTVRANGIMSLVAKMEDAISGDSGKPAIQVLTSNGGPSIPRLSMAYATALRHAGADVSDEEVYLSIVSGFSEGDVDAAHVMQRAIMAILAIMAPPIAVMVSGGGGDDEEKKQQAAG